MIRITHEQARYLAYGPSADGKIEPQGDVVIEHELASRDGWIFVHQAGYEDNDGSGVWVDTHGNEHHGPGQLDEPRLKDRVAYTKDAFLGPGRKDFILIEPV